MFEDETPIEDGVVLPIASTEEAADDFFPEDDAQFVLPDPSSVITVRTSGGDTKYVPVEGPTSVGALLQIAGLTIQGQAQYWLNGTQIAVDTVVPAGETMTIIGSVKGGTR